MCPQKTVAKFAVAVTSPSKTRNPGELRRRGSALLQRRGSALLDLQLQGSRDIPEDATAQQGTYRLLLTRM